MACHPDLDEKSHDESETEANDESWNQECNCPRIVFPLAPPWCVLTAHFWELGVELSDRVTHPLCFVPGPFKGDPAKHSICDEYYGPSSLATFLVLLFHTE